MIKMTRCVDYYNCKLKLHRITIVIHTTYNHELHCVRNTNLNNYYSMSLHTVHYRNYGIVGTEDISDRLNHILKKLIS
jgi:hypothetical protein